MNIVFFLIAISIYGVSATVVSTGDFNKDFVVTWSPAHVNTSFDGKNRSLILDKDSGSGFVTKDMFLFGQFDMQIKLIPGNSSGTVVAFYLVSNSNQSNRDELDFEFLGNEPGRPYILQTNVFSNGHDDREQRIKLWFDPTTDFHTYSVLWNLHQIVFMVDWVPIRTFRNHEDKDVPYPQRKPMGLIGSIWNGEDWATNGGKGKIDWTEGPFVASFRNYKMDACVWKGDLGSCWAENQANWWNQDKSSSLTSAQRRLFKWVRKNYLIYDYCQDNKRFNNSLPKECYLTMY